MSSRLQEFIYKFVTQGTGDVDTAINRAKTLEEQAAKTAAAAKTIGTGTGSGLTELTGGLTSASGAASNGAASFGRYSASVGAATQAHILLTGEAHKSVTQIQAASSAIRIFEGHSSIRAVEQFAIKMLGLGPALQAIFPLVGAIAFAEIIGQTVLRVGELYNAWDPVIRAQKRSLAVGEAQLAQYVNLGKELEKLRFDEIGRTQGPAAKLRAEARQGDEIDQKTSLAQINRLTPERNKLNEEYQALKASIESSKATRQQDFNVKGDRSGAGGDNSGSVSRLNELRENVERLDNKIDFYTLALKVEGARKIDKLAGANKIDSDKAQVEADKAIAEYNRQFKALESVRTRADELNRSGIGKIDIEQRDFNKANPQVSQLAQDEFNKLRSNLTIAALRSIGVGFDVVGNRTIPRGIGRESGQPDLIAPIESDTKTLSLQSHNYLSNLRKDATELQKELNTLTRSLEILDSIDRDRANRASAKAERIVGLIAQPGQEKLAIEATFAIRLKETRELEEIDQRRINLAKAEIEILKDSTVEDNIRRRGDLEAQVILDTAKLRKDTEEATDKARENRELDYLALQRRGLEENKRLAEGFTAALFGGKDGVSSFFAGQGKNLVTQIGGNVLGTVFTGGTNALKGAIGGIAPPGSFLDKALGGTILDPKTAVERNISSLDANTKALKAFGGGGSTGIPFLDQLKPLRGSDIGNLNALGPFGGLISDANGLTGGGNGNSTLKSLSTFLYGDVTSGRPLGFTGGAGSVLSGGLFAGFGKSVQTGPGTADASTAARAGNIAASTGLVIGTGIGIYDGIKRGGASGISQAIGSGLAFAAAVDQEPISKAVLAIGASIAGAVSYFAGKGARDFAAEQAQTLESRKYNAPISISQAYDTSTGRFGDTVSYDASGRVRGLSGVRNTTIIINAVDGESVARLAQTNRSAFATAVASVVRDGDHPISTDIRNAALGFA